MNRRISLVVLNAKTERQIRGLPDEEEIQNESDAAQVLHTVGDQDAPAEAAPAEGGAPADGGTPKAAPPREGEQLALPAGQARDPA